MMDRLAWDRHVSESSPVIRGTMITADHVISLVLDGWTWADIRRVYPQLTEADLRACMAYRTAEESSS
jgi:uncharacterized protein (DUF433 family)